MYRANFQQQHLNQTTVCSNNNGQRQNEKLHDMNYVVRFFFKLATTQYANILTLGILHTPPLRPQPQQS